MTDSGILPVPRTDVAAAIAGRYARRSLPEPPFPRPSAPPHDFLVERARAGDHEAFSELATRTVSRLYAIALRILRDVPAAEDVVQQSLVDAWRDLPGLREIGAFDTWLIRLLVRNAYREARGARSARLAYPLAAIAADPATAVDDRDEMERAFRRLTPEHRAVLTLRHYLDWEPTEIARALGVADGTVRSRLHYALASLRAALEADQRSPRREHPSR